MKYDGKHIPTQAIYYIVDATLREEIQCLNFAVCMQY